MSRARKYPEELLERATRLVFESGRPIARVGRDLGIAPETLRKYVRQVEADEGRRHPDAHLARQLAPFGPGRGYPSSPAALRALVRSEDKWPHEVAPPLAVSGAFLHPGAHLGR